MVAVPRSGFYLGEPDSRSLDVETRVARSAIRDLKSRMEARSGNFRQSPPCCREMRNRCSSYGPKNQKGLSNRHYATDETNVS